MSEETVVPAEATEEKPAAKKTTRKPATKTAAKATASKSATAKKTAAAAKKTTTAAKKTTTRKTTTRKTAAKKAEEASAAPVAEEQLSLVDVPELPVADEAPEAVPEKKPVRKRRTSKKAEDAEKPVEAEVEKTEDTDKPVEATKAEDTKAADAETASDEAASQDKADAPAQAGSEAEGGSTPDAASAEGADDAESGEQREGKRNRRRNRRSRNNHQRKEIVPSATRDELALLDDDALTAKAIELGVDASEYGERDDLVSAVYDALLQAEGFVMVEGILDLLPDGYGFIRTNGYLPGEHDVYVGVSTVRRQGLRKGDYITGRVRPPRENEKYPALNTIVTLNDEPFEGPTHRVKFANLTPVYPDERLFMEHGKDTLTARSIDLVAPIGKGQRGLIVSPPKAGKTTVLKDIAAAISANNPEVHLMCLLVDERPEEVTDMERSINGEVISSTFDMPCENHIAVAELVIERAKRLVENGQDVVILLDSITRLARAYNLGQPASGRILSGGVDSTALYPPKKFLGAARNIEDGGSLTILGTALVDTGSKMDEVIFEEFKGTGNMELKLDRALADKRVFPAIDPVTSGTRKEELLIDPQEAPLIWGVRSLLANMNNTERAMKMLVSSLKATETNREFLIKSARKASKAAQSL
ncbi:MAG: transcription termination factor Rho [Coriobacteriia bacterium]|nr:MAG: transcription termination factor Rho [Coriobacteriia bacterium]